MDLRSLITLAALCVSAATAVAEDARLQGIAAALKQGYGEEFQGMAQMPDGRVMLHFAGRAFLYDDGREKSFNELLDQPDMEDMFRQSYPLTNPTGTLPVNFDPGRVRVEAFFKLLYGSSAAEVEKACVSVDFCGHKVRFNSRCGAAQALAAVSKDLEQLFAVKPALRIYVAELGGTFTWRLIAGTTRLSNHSFGNAIDLNVAKSHYWRWDSPAKMAGFSRKSWPTEIIQAFENRGFIWGGKWWHYDTMHFEYRPDLIAYSRAFPEPPKPGPAD